MRPWVVAGAVVYVAAVVAAAATVLRGLEVQQRYGCAGPSAPYLEAQRCTLRGAQALLLLGLTGVAVAIIDWLR